MGFPVGWSGRMVAGGDICGEICHCFCLFLSSPCVPLLEEMKDLPGQYIVGTDNRAASLRI